MHRHEGFRELDRQECLRLLALASVGRIVYTCDALPAVLPVNFSLDHDYAVLLRTAAGSPLARAVDQAVVAFETDEIDVVAHTGWSVIVTGRATLVTDPREQERLNATGPRSWAPTPDGVFIRIDPELVTGRALSENGHVTARCDTPASVDVP